MHIRSGQTLRLAMLLVLAGTLAITASAQFTITIPKLPKVKKDQPKPDPTPAATDNGSDNNSSSSGTDNRSTPPADQEKPKTKTCDSDTFYQVWNEDIQKTLEDINSFTAGRDYFVRDFNDDENKYLKMALSASERQDEEKNWADDATKRCVNAR
jgi:hypothetical protein